RFGGRTSMPRAASFAFSMPRAARTARYPSLPQWSRACAAFGRLIAIPSGSSRESVAVGRIVSIHWPPPWAKPSNPPSVSSVQNAMRMAVATCGLKKKATCHTLRHSFATHLLEGGVSIGQVCLLRSRSVGPSGSSCGGSVSLTSRSLGCAYLGHANLYSTLVYLHVTEISQSKGREVQAQLLDYV